MRLLQSPPTLLSLLAVVLSSSHTTTAKPYPREDSVLEARNNTLEARCAIPCGYSGQLCCESGQTCFTDVNNQAQCGTGGGGGTQQNYVDSGQQNHVNNGQPNNLANGQYQVYTTTFVETDLVTRTSVYTSYFGGVVATHAPSPTVQEFVPVITARACDTSLYESPCGGTCCTSGEYCSYDKAVCVAVGGAAGDFSSAYYSSVMEGSAYIRPTSFGIETITSTGAPTTTVPFVPPTTTGEAAGMGITATNNGLSPGAIAGIVIGVLLGILLLFLFCACCVFKGLIDGILRLFGLGPKRRRREETYIETRHSTHGGSGGRTWFGASRPGRVDRTKKKSSGVGGALGVAGGLTALAVLLGLKRRRDARDKQSYGSGSSYSYDYTTSASE